MTIRTPLVGIEAERLFSLEPPSDFYVSMIQAVLGDAEIQINGVQVRATIDTVVAKTASAQCEIRAFGPDSRDAILFVDVAFIELLALTLSIVLPRVNPIGKVGQRLLVERMLFHCCIQAGNYDALLKLEPTMTPSLAAGRYAYHGEIGLRLLLGVEALVSHELEHWRAMMGPGSVADDLALKAQVKALAEAGWDRWAAKMQERYSLELRDASIAGVFEQLEYWFNEGWPEIACDLYGLRAAWTTAHHMDIPPASFGVTCGTLTQLVSLMGIASAMLQGAPHEQIAARNQARSLTIEASIQYIAMYVGVPADVWSHAVTLRRRANKRFLDLIGAPLMDRANELLSGKVLVPSRRDTVSAIRRHGFAARPAGHFVHVRAPAPYPPGGERQIQSSQLVTAQRLFSLPKK